MKTSKNNPTLRPKAFCGSVLVLTVTIMFMVSFELLMMGLLSTSTLSAEGAINSTSQEAKEEGLAAMVDFRTNIIRAYNARERYATGFQASNLTGFRNDVEFTDKRFYVMNDAFTGAVASPYRVTARLVGNQSPYTLSVVASGNGVNYTLNQRLNLPDYTPTAWFTKRSRYRDTVGLLQTLLQRSYLYRSTVDRFQGTYEESQLVNGIASTNTQQGLPCTTPNAGPRCYPSFWGNEVQYQFRVGGATINTEGFLNAGEWSAAHGFDGGSVDLTASNMTAQYSFQFEAGDAQTQKHQTILALPNITFSTYPSTRSGYSWTAIVYSPTFETPFQFTATNNAFAAQKFTEKSLPVDLTWSDELMLINTFGPNGVQS